MVDREDALTINTTTTTPTVNMASLMSEINWLTTLVATLAATNGGGGDGTGGGGSTGGGRRKYQRGKDKDGNALPICPHCKKLAKHKA